MQKEFRRDTPRGQVRVVNPSPLPGLGTRSGLTLEIQDRSGAGGLNLAQAAPTLHRRDDEEPKHRHALPTYHELWRAADPAGNRSDQGEQLGVPLQNLFDALGTYVGSSSSTLFNRFGFVYQVYVQSEAMGRRTRFMTSKALPVLNGRGARAHRLPGGRGEFTTGPTAVLSYNNLPRHRGGD